MQFLDKLKTWWTFKQNRGHRGKRLHILDAGSFSGSRRRGGRPAPLENLQLLRSLSQFARKEQIAVSVVLEGRPLREAEHGHSFEGVNVYYAESSDDAGDLVISLMRDGLRRNQVTVITSDPQIEERALVAGGTTMRGSTLRKAMDSVSGPEGGRDRDPSHQQNRRRQRRRRRGPRPEGGEGGEGGGGGGGGGGGNDAVRQLVDLVE